MLVLPGRGEYMARAEKFVPTHEHDPFRDASKESDYMFATTEPAPGEKLKIDTFAGKLLSKFVEICDEVREMRLYIATYFPETL